MSNLRWGIIAACAALVVSVAAGIISEVRLLYIILRAAIFAVVFFGIGFGIRMVISSFMPELLYLEEEPVIHDSNPQAGSRINITVGSTGEYAVPEMYKDSGDHNELGNIEDLISGAFRPRASDESPPVQPRKAPLGIDGNTDNDYNMQDSAQDMFGSDNFEFPSVRPSSAAAPEKPVFTPTFGDDLAGLGGLPDLDAMAMAFSSGGELPRAPAAQAMPAGDSLSVMEPIDEQLFDAAPIVKPVSKSGKSQQLDGDFNPKELAQGIRTVLSKDK